MKRRHDGRVVLITGTSEGIGKYLAGYYCALGDRVIGCSRRSVDDGPDGYEHFIADVSDETTINAMFAEIRRRYGRLDVLINNAGIASMNHVLLTPMKTVRSILETNVAGTFLLSREAAKLMRKPKGGRIVNFVTTCLPWKLEGEAIYVASKSAVLALTQVLAKELADLGITVNAVGPTPIQTSAIKGVPKAKIDGLIRRQAIRRMGKYGDVSNAVDFFIRPESDFITGQVLYLGGA